ncbi:MAG: hypothetical protein R2932_52745 [Caldilineaceae bacterium]
MAATGTASSAILSIRTLGEVIVRVESSGQSIAFEARTVQALFLYLVCQGRPLGRDYLAELLWPERSQPQGRANLRVAIHRLPTTRPLSAHHPSDHCLRPQCPPDARCEQL